MARIEISSLANADPAAGPQTPEFFLTSALLRIMAHLVSWLLNYGTLTEQFVADMIMNETQGAFAC
jgi:hypothetical protein